MAVASVASKSAQSLKALSKASRSPFLIASSRSSSGVALLFFDPKLVAPSAGEMSRAVLSPKVAAGASNVAELAANSAAGSPGAANEA
jgi:hypothetical protein